MGHQPSKRAIKRAIAAAILLAFAVVPAGAQEFYAGKTVSLIIGFGPGGGYDLWGRTLARHIGKHLPGNPTVVPQNMPGAGSYVAASHLYAAAPKDGTAFAIIARDAALGPLSGAPGARFDATKMSWLGSPTREHNVCIANATAAVKDVKALKDTTLVLGDTGPGTGTRSYPKVLNDLFGFKFKLVHLRELRQRQAAQTGLDPEEGRQRAAAGRRLDAAGAQGRAECDGAGPHR
jgi:tripartite-type tricarboxylate transporter receptor subunit TctC